MTRHTPDPLFLVRSVAKMRRRQAPSPWPVFAGGLGLLVLGPFMSGLFGVPGESGLVVSIAGLVVMYLAKQMADHPMRRRSRLAIAVVVRTAPDRDDDESFEFSAIVSPRGIGADVVERLSTVAADLRGVPFEDWYEHEPDDAPLHRVHFWMQRDQIPPDSQPQDLRQVPVLLLYRYVQLGDAPLFGCLLVGLSLVPFTWPLLFLVRRMLQAGTWEIDRAQPIACEMWNEQLAHDAQIQPR